jgi:hypothetical protein
VVTRRKRGGLKKSPDLKAVEETPEEETDNGEVKDEPKTPTVVLVEMSVVLHTAEGQRIPRKYRFYPAMDGASFHFKEHQVAEGLAVSLQALQPPTEEA